MIAEKIKDRNRNRWARKQKHKETEFKKKGSSTRARKWELQVKEALQDNP